MVWLGPTIVGLGTNGWSGTDKMVMEGGGQDVDSGRGAIDCLYN